MPLQYKIVKVPDYITDVESYLTTLGSVASGSYQLLHLYNGQAFLVSGSQGTTINVTGSVTAGTVSSSAQVTALLPAGVVSSSGQVKVLLPSGTVSSSTQISTTLALSGSTGNDTITLNNGAGGDTLTFSGSNGVTTTVTNNTLTIGIPTGVVSSSAQISSGSFTGSFTGSFNGVHSASTGGYTYNGHSLFNYGQFYDTTTQSGSAGVAYPMKFNTTDISSGVSIVSSSRITVANSGIYNLQFSAQLNNNGGGGSGNTITIWFRVTGSNVPFSSTNVAVINNSPYVVAAWNYASQLTSGSYIEIMWANDNANLTIPTLPTSSVAPAIPSVIATMTQIA